MWVLTEELSPKMTLEVASGLFELYLTLADIQCFWSSIPGRWVSCPPPVLQSALGGLCARDSPRGLLRLGTWDMLAQGV